MSDRGMEEYVGGGIGFGKPEVVEGDLATFQNEMRSVLSAINNKKIELVVTDLTTDDMEMWVKIKQLAHGGVTDLSVASFKTYTNEVQALRNSTRSLFVSDINNLIMPHYDKLPQE